MFALGAIYGGGKNFPADRVTAQRWLHAAGELGHGHAQLMLGRYLTSGAAGNQNHQEARIWLERAIAQGVADAEPDLAALRASARGRLSVADQSKRA
jgi:TPR repeat protein